MRRHTLPGQDTAEYAQAFVRAAIKAAWRDPRRFYGLMKPDGPVIGTCMLALSQAGAGRERIGWDLHPMHWGRGFATEAARALLGYGFRGIGLREVTAQCYAENVASRSAAGRTRAKRRSPLPSRPSVRSGIVV